MHWTSPSVTSRQRPQPHDMTKVHRISSLDVRTFADLTGTSNYHVISGIERRNSPREPSAPRHPHFLLQHDQFQRAWGENREYRSRSHTRPSRYRPGHELSPRSLALIVECESEGRTCSAYRLFKRILRLFLTVQRITCITVST